MFFNWQDQFHISDQFRGNVATAKSFMKVKQSTKKTRTETNEETLSFPILCNLSVLYMHIILTGKELLSSPVVNAIECALIKHAG